MKLSGAGEASIIGLFRHAAAVTGMTAGVLKGIGDDAAVLSDSQGLPWLVSTDLLVEHIHFNSRTITPRQLGFKSIAVNVSDIRAMNGRPLYALLSIAVPTGYAFSDIEAFAQGVREAESRFGVSVVGGDTCRSARDTFVSVMVMGHAETPVYRSGARPGERLYVTGTLGDSAAGLELLTRLNDRVDPGGSSHPNIGTRLGISCNDADLAYLMKRHLVPEPVMRELGLDPSAMIDVSDGLLIDLDRICNESGIGVRLNVDTVPISDALRAVCPTLERDPLDLALKGGEDYELLFTAPESVRVTGATCIGEILPEGREMILKGQKVGWPAVTGYDHFRSA